MRRVLMRAVAGFVLVAAASRAAEALGIGGHRLCCACAETCWCKQPGLTLFRWVTPVQWHDISRDVSGLG